MVKYQVPDYVSLMAKDLITRLLVRKMSKRLGNLANGSVDVKRALWFDASKINFPAVRRKEAAAPWVPDVKNPFDASNFDDFSAAEKEVNDSRPLTVEEQKHFIDF